MKNIITLAVLFISLTMFAQVGINNTSPKATLDITPKTTDGSKPEGLLIPQLDGNSLKTPSYGTSQKGVIVYAKSAANPTDTKTVNVTAEGYYYFDGSVWQKMTGASSGDTTNDAWINDTTNGLVKLGTKADGTARAAGTDFVAKDNGQVGIGTSTPGSKLQVEGSLGLNYTSISSTTYTIAANDYYLNYTGTNDAVFTLPSGTSSTCNCKGRAYEIVNNSNYNITVNAASSETINGNSSFVITAKMVAKIVNTNLASGNTWSNVYYSPIEFSANQGSITTKTLYNSSSSDLTKTVRIGRFEIRVNNNIPEFRLIYPPSSSVTIYRNIEENWENNGYASQTYSSTFTTANWNTYQYLGIASNDGSSTTEKNTFWLSYPGDSTLVKVEVLVMGNGTASTTWAIICTQY